MRNFLLSICMIIALTFGAIATPVTYFKETPVSLFEDYWLQSEKEEKWMLSAPYPNPASDQISFNYRLPSDTYSARLVLRNLTGVIVANHELDKAGRRIRLETENFNNGIYMYTLFINEQAMTTKKLIIQK